jgi:hypothetical protein
MVRSCTEGSILYSRGILEVPFCVDRGELEDAYFSLEVYCKFYPVLRGVLEVLPCVPETYWFYPMLQRCPYVAEECRRQWLAKFTVRVEYNRIE